MNADRLPVILQQAQEAYCVRRGLPVERTFSDDELAPAIAAIANAEGVLYAGIDPRPLIPFRVTVSTFGRPPEQISILSRSSCDAAVQAINLLFSDADDCITHNFRLKVEAISLGATASREAA